MCSGHKISGLEKHIIETPMVLRTTPKGYGAPKKYLINPGMEYKMIRSYTNKTYGGN